MEDNVIPEGVSGCRYMYHLTEGTDFKPLTSFEEAKKCDDAYLIMEGDYGGQIYLSVPLNQVGCKYQVLEKLLLEVDSREWSCNKGEGSGIYFERMEPGTGIPGGMGGGIALDGLWVHEDLEGLKERINRILNGESTSLDH